MPATPPPALHVKAISKSFGPTRVLTDAQLTLQPGEIHALVGENGSGKSTLVKILAGYHAPDPGGSIRVAGVELVPGDPRSTEDLGLRFVHQDLGLVAELDCMDNLALGPGYQLGRSRSISWKRERVVAQAALGRLGYDIDVRRRVSSLSISERTVLAVARALSERRSQGHVLILDEPTANLPAPEVEHLFALLRRVRDSGVAILFISHHFNEVFSLADKVTVLRDGQVVATERVVDLVEDDLVELMIGRRLDRAIPAARAATAETEPLLTVEAVTGRVVQDLSFCVQPGEVLGIAGITGSGREEVAKLLGGDLPHQGQISLAGQPLAPGRPDRCIRAGLSYVPAEWLVNGILPGSSVRENLTISRLKPFLKLGYLQQNKERAEVGALLDTFDVRPRRMQAEIGTLSGGNQQKVMLARAMRLAPRVLLLEEPTQGVDVGAQADIHHRIRQAAAAGSAVIVCSSVSEELAEVADRVLVLAGGRVVQQLFGPLDPDRITAACLSTTEETTS